MNAEHLKNFADLSRPGMEAMAFIDELKNFRLERLGFDGRGQFAAGIFCTSSLIQYVPNTALSSLRQVLEIKKIPVVTENGIIFDAQYDPSLEKDEFELRIGVDGVMLLASSPNGFRYGVYQFEEELAKLADGELLKKTIRLAPQIKWRISRCFFSPIGRPPSGLDELEDEIDYYPEQYLSQLAHERINGLWITMYLKDMPSRFFPGHGEKAALKLAKLRRTVAQCEKYGIACFIYLAEPKGFTDHVMSLPFAEAALHPEMAGHRAGGARSCFCSSSEAGKAYLAEGIEYLFRHIPQLGGIINIMCLESSFPCAGIMVYEHLGTKCNCPVCSRRDVADIFAETARLMKDAMCRYNPDAEFVGWFYFAYFKKGGLEEKQFEKIADKWPDDCYLMFNFEVGGEAMQEGGLRAVLDYSLSYIGPSDLWCNMAKRVKKRAAKLQVGCSHEDASVPMIPVPGNLYRKYRELHQWDAQLVMQCWYFGNYPGVMNRAAGRLSFRPLPATEEIFLDELALPEWGEDARVVVEAWKYFGQSYREFPESLNFKWFGPLHHSIVFPLHLIPVDEPIAPSYFFGYPVISGDRIGEMIGFSHTLAETLTLMERMDLFWQKGMALLEPLKEKYGKNRKYLLDILLAEAIQIQINSSYLVLKFYQLREEWIFDHADNLAEMAGIVRKEIDNTRKMQKLCELDSRLGYHSEAEGYLFFPKKLAARAELLQELLDQDFPKFDPASRCRLDDTLNCYRMESVIEEKSFSCPSQGMKYFETLGDAEFAFYLDGTTLFLEVTNCRKYVELHLEVCRLWQIFPIKYDSAGSRLSLEDDVPWQTVATSGKTIVAQIDLKFLNPFRRSAHAPIRFNLEIDGVAVKEKHPLPGRLLMGSANSHDLAILRFDE